MRVLVCLAAEQSHKESQHAINFGIGSITKSGTTSRQLVRGPLPGCQADGPPSDRLLPGATLGETTENLSRLLADQ